MNYTPTINHPTKILVVDDEPKNRKLLGQLLASEG